MTPEAKRYRTTRDLPGNPVIPDGTVVRVLSWEPSADANDLTEWWVRLEGHGEFDYPFDALAEIKTPTTGNQQARWKRLL